MHRKRADQNSESADLYAIFISLIYQNVTALKDHVKKKTALKDLNLEYCSSDIYTSQVLTT